MKILLAITSLNSQSCIRRPLCSTLKFENLNISLFKIHDYFFMISFLFLITSCYFSLDPTIFLLLLKTWKKKRSKVAHNRPRTLYFKLENCKNQVQIDRGRRWLTTAETFTHTQLFALYKWKQISWVCPMYQNL